MARPIDADAVIEEMSEKHRPNFHEDLKAYHMWIMWYWALKEAPTIDAVSVVHGEWIDKGNWMGIECSRCKCHSRYVTPFCPQCGARMKGADDEMR